MKRYLSIVLAVIFALSLMITGCDKKSDYNPLEGVETTYITDSCGRDVEIPTEITRIAPSGNVATMVLMGIAPEYMVGLNSSPSTDQMKYYPEELWYLPTFGQFYGSKANLNMEALIAAEPQLIIDVGDVKTGIASDMTSVQDQTGIPTIFLEGTLEKLPEAYRTLGKLLGKEEKAEEMAQFIEEAVAMAEENSAKISEEDIKTVYFGTGAAGLAANANGSSQADVIDIIGATNAIVPPRSEETDKGGGTTVNMEELYIADPDVIVLSAGGPYDELETNEWSELTAVIEGNYYEIPNLPYCWLASPPSVNRVLGIYWLGNLVYPDIYDYDVAEKACEFYSLFWNYDLTYEEAQEMLQNSTLKSSY